MASAGARSLLLGGEGGHVASAVARAYNWGLGWKPQRGPDAQLKAVEHFASKGDGKFAKQFCVLQIPLNCSRDLTTPLLGIICRPWASTC